MNGRNGKNQTNKKSTYPFYTLPKFLRMFYLKILHSLGRIQRKCQRVPDSVSARSEPEFLTLWLLWNTLERVPEGSRGSYRQFWSTSVIQDVCSFGGQKHILIKIRHFFLFLLWTLWPRALLWRSERSMGPSNPLISAPAHLCIHSTRNKKMYVIFSHQYLFLMSLMNIL